MRPPACTGRDLWLSPGIPTLYLRRRPDRRLDVGGRLEYNRLARSNESFIMRHESITQGRVYDIAPSPMGNVLLKSVRGSACNRTNTPV